MKSVLVVSNLSAARALGAKRKSCCWMLDGARIVTPRSVKAGALRGHSLDRVDDPGALLDERALEDVMLSLFAASGQYVRGAS